MLIEDYRNLKITSGNVELHLLLDFSRKRFEFSTPTQDSLVSLKGNNFEDIVDTIECIKEGLKYIETNKNIFENNIINLL